MRTVRLCLQRHGSKISRVVFCISAGVEEAAYVEAAAVYFPRNHDEEAASQAVTADEQLDEFGDLVLGRGVSIGRVPADTAALADGRSSAAGEGGAGQAGDWSQTLLRYSCPRTALNYFVCTSTRDVALAAMRAADCVRPSFAHISRGRGHEKLWRWRVRALCDETAVDQGST
jgi:hypothetical protein